MTPLQVAQEFGPVLEPLGDHAAEFFLAAGLYHARKVSFAAAAHLAGLSLDEFLFRLKEHFGSGYRLADEVVREDIALAEALVKRGAGNDPR